MRKYFLLCLYLSAYLFTPQEFSFAASASSEYMCELGTTLYNQGKYEEALSEFNKVLLSDPDNEKAKRYVERIFSKSTVKSDSDQPALDEKVFVEPKETSVDLNNEVLPETSLGNSKEAIQRDLPVYSRDDAIDNTLKDLSELERKKKEEEKKIIKAGPLIISGETQLSFGINSDGDFIWKRANFDLNERFKSWRMTSDAGFNRRFNTYDPRIYDRLDVNVDTDNKEGFNFHTNVTFDPWSFVGKSDKTTITGSNGDTAEIQLLYWSNTGYVVNDTVYTSLMGDTFGIPELKVYNEKTKPTTATSYRNNATFNIPEMKIKREFQPVRELWLDYNTEPVKFRIFPIAYQDQAYTSDDPLNITNRRIWWQDSMWLRKYQPGNYNSADITVPSFTKGHWDDSLSFISKDSNGTYLTALRGFSLSLQPGESTIFDTTVATPKHLWQDYAQVDNLITASRLKHYLTDNFAVGGTVTSRLGFKVDPKSKLDSQNYVGGLDLGYEMFEGVKAQAEVLSSKSYYDTTNSDYETKSRGNAYYFSLVTRYPRESIMDLKYGYDEIKLDKTESFLMKSKLYLSRMDKAFDSSLSNFHNTRQDTFWSRHIHFRKPMEYFYGGLKNPTTRWDDLNATRIGDGIDKGRNVIGFRFETILEDRFSNLFDIRNVHNVNGKFIENVVRDEMMVRVTDKLTAKGLGIYQKLPRTLSGFDPFIYDGNTGDFWTNSAVPDGEDPTLKTGSVGLNYDFFDWLSINGIYERTNDYTLAYGDFPRNVLRNDTTLWNTYYQNDNLYRDLLPFLYSQGYYPQAPYEYYNVFKCGLGISPLENMDIYLDYTRNEFESAAQNSDGMNHIGLSLAYMPTKKIGMSFKYTYSRWQDQDRLINGDTDPRGHHNFFSEFRYLPSKDDEVILQYGEGNSSPIGNMTMDPYGGDLLSIDTQHIIRAYYRRRF